MTTLTLGPPALEFCRTSNRSTLARCSRCEWLYLADDSEFPSRFIFDLAYELDEGNPVLRAIEPVAVVTTTDNGRPLFVHDFTPTERAQIGLWFAPRIDNNLASMESAILESEARN